MSPRRTREAATVGDYEALAQAFDLLGSLRLADNLNQLARAANLGALPLPQEIEDEVIATCAAVQAIRMDLMRALGCESEARS